MKLEEAIDSCHARSAVRRKSEPDVKYWKNHTLPIVSRVPIADRLADDWEEYDPREDDECSLFVYND